LLFFWIGGKTLFLDEPEFLDQVIFSSAEKIAKNSKKYKIWFTNRFLYEDWIERFGSIIYNLKLKIKRKAHSASVLCKAP
jgi:hypothetical protein